MSAGSPTMRLRLGSGAVPGGSGSGGGGGFRRRDVQSRLGGRFVPNMTPMVDVVMVILIFFMASAAFVGEEWFLRAVLGREGSTPPTPAAAMAEEAATEKPADPFELPSVRIAIRLERGADGSVTASALDRSGVSIGEALARLKEFVGGSGRGGVDTAKVVAVISASDDVGYADVVRVHEGCVRLGLERVSVSTK